MGFGSLGFRSLALNVLGVEWFWNFGFRVLVVFKVLAGLGGFGFSLAKGHQRGKIGAVQG